MTTHRHIALGLLDAAWLISVAIYVLTGMTSVSFHGDESQHLYTSRDFETLFVDHDLKALMAGPPYRIDDDPWQRILNGSVTRYSIGLSRRAMGWGPEALPPKPGWNWGQEYKINVETGHRPPAALLAAARLPSTIFLVLSAAFMFGIGWQFGRRILAYALSALYVLNPIVLLNGRRAMQEGSLLCFGLLTIWLAILIARGRSRWYWWAALTVAGALTIASKHTGVIFVVAAFGWVFLGAGRQCLPRLLLSSALTAVMFVALSPALWHNPPARIRDLIIQRGTLLEAQGQGMPTTLLDRVDGILTQPFQRSPAHFETGFWTDFTPITSEIDRYMSSPFSGARFGRVLGFPLTLLAGWGIVALLRSRRSWHDGVLLWFAITTGGLLINPLPWQRYYLPLIPVATVLAGAGGMRIVLELRQRGRAGNMGQDSIG